MSNYFNEAGEPLMDGAAMRYEMYLDSTYEPEPDYFLNEGVYYEECDEDHQCEDCGECVDACICDDRDEGGEDSWLDGSYEE